MTQAIFYPQVAIKLAWKNHEMFFRLRKSMSEWCQDTHCLPWTDTTPVEVWKDILTGHERMIRLQSQAIQYFWVTSEWVVTLSDWRVLYSQGKENFLTYIKENCPPIHNIKLN